MEVKPLCEYLEVTDESWRDAIEGQKKIGLL